MRSNREETEFAQGGAQVVLHGNGLRLLFGGPIRRSHSPLRGEDADLNRVSVAVLSAPGRRTTAIRVISVLARRADYRLLLGTWCLPFCDCHIANPSVTAA